LEPYDVTVGTDDNYYITDRAANQILRYRLVSGAIETVAGSPVRDAGHVNMTGVYARFSSPSGIVATRGGLVVADSANHVLRLVTQTGSVTDLVGAAGSPGDEDTADPGGPRFRFPTGLAVDGAGVIYVADAYNNKIRRVATDDTVTTIPYAGLHQPNGVDVDHEGNLWIADTRNHQVKVITPAGVELKVFGSGSVGSTDYLIGSLATFNLPRNLKFIDSAVGAIVADTANNTLRQIHTNLNVMDFSVTTISGIAGSAGRVDGATNIATFNAPIGLHNDLLTGSLLVTDSAGAVNEGGALRLYQLTQPLEKIATPEIGYLTRETSGSAQSSVSVTRFIGVTNATFDNFVHIAIKAADNVRTTAEFGKSSTNGLTDSVPIPNEGSPSVDIYEDTFAFTTPIVGFNDFMPDLTMKARSFSSGRPSSDVPVARFQFVTAAPSISGNNPNSFTVGNITTNAQMYYTLDGTDPPETEVEAQNAVAQIPATVYGPIENGDSVPALNFGMADTIEFRIRAYATGMKRSGVASQVFSKTSFDASKITFGFAAGEGASQFQAAVGQHFYAPITLDMLAGERELFGLQFALGVTNLPADAASGRPAAPTIMGSGNIGYKTLLKAQDPDANVLRSLPPAFATADPDPAVFQPASLANMMFTNFNGGRNFFGIGYLERPDAEKKGLFDTTLQNLISFSQAHNTLFEGGNGKVLVGAFIVKIPTPANVSLTGHKYRIRVSRPSAVAGLDTDVYLDAPTGGSMAGGAPANALKEITIGNPGYVVGDVEPFGWYNAGDFGDTNILMTDLMQVFQAVVYNYNRPPGDKNDPNQPISDYYDAYDSSNGTAVQSFDGVDKTMINGIMMGDNDLKVDDIYITFRRALDPDLDWIRRYWEDGTKKAEAIKGEFRGVTDGPIANLPSVGLAPKGQPNLAAQGLSTVSPFVNFYADDISIQDGSSTVSVPIRAKISGNYPVRTLAMNLNVRALDGSPALETPVEFVPGRLGAPTVDAQINNSNYSAAWLNAAQSGIFGDELVGTLLVNLPQSADVDSAYTIEFEHISASPNGYGVLRQKVRNGLLTLRDRSASSFGDRIPDSWRLRHFGNLQNILSHADADADGDGVSNLREFLAGTHPNDAKSALRMAAPTRAFGSSGISLSWPTVDGKKYVVECATSLFAEVWTPVTATMTGNGDESTFVDTEPLERPRFYRVRLIEE